MRIYGVEGIQKHIRQSVKIARYFEKLVRSDERYEIVTEVTLGLVCFRIKVLINNWLKPFVKKIKNIVFKYT